MPRAILPEASSLTANLIVPSPENKELTKDGHTTGVLGTRLALLLGNSWTFRLYLEAADGSRPGGILVIVSTSRIKLHPEKRKEFFQTIGQLLEPLKKTRGCVAFRCYIDSTDENSSLLMSEWETEADLDSYLDSNDSAILRGAITILGVETTDFNGAPHPVGEIFERWETTLDKKSLEQTPKSKILFEGQDLRR